VEERTPHFRTGLGTHHVDYGNSRHPLDTKEQGNRRDVQGQSNVFKPLRIHFETLALDNERNADNAGKIDFIKREILPRIGAFWSQALAVVPVVGNLFVSESALYDGAFCGDSNFTKVPTSHTTLGVSGADLILHISGAPSTRFCSGSTVAVGVACNFDQFDRPIAGAMVRFVLLVVDCCRCWISL
jgi:hypothetical protein